VQNRLAEAKGHGTEKRDL